MSRFGECNFSFLKNSQVQINFKLNEKNRMNTYYYNNTNMKKFSWKSAGRCFLKPFFVEWSAIYYSAIYIQSRKLFLEFPPVQNFCHCFTWYHWPEKFLIVFLPIISRITMCNLHWCYTVCTRVARFALVLHLNCTALGQSESSNFFMCIIKFVTISRNFCFTNNQPTAGVFQCSVRGIECFNIQHVSYC